MSVVMLVLFVSRQKCLSSTPGSLAAPLSPSLSPLLLSTLAAVGLHAQLQLWGKLRPFFSVCP